MFQGGSENNATEHVHRQKLEVAGQTRHRHDARVGRRLECRVVSWARRRGASAGSGPAAAAGGRSGSRGSQRDQWHCLRRNARGGPAAVDTLRPD